MVTPTRAVEERDMDSGDKTDDGEVELNLPREDALERDPPGWTSRIYRGPPLRGCQ